MSLFEPAPTTSPAGPPATPPEDLGGSRTVEGEPEIVPADPLIFDDLVASWAQWYEAHRKRSTAPPDPLVAESKGEQG